MCKFRIKKNHNICRRRKKLAAVRESQQQEEKKFLQRLESVAERKREMERRYKLISKLHPNRLNSFLEWERETAAKKIQTWWRNSRPDTVDLVKEVTRFLLLEQSMILFTVSFE